MKTNKSQLDDLPALGMLIDRIVRTTLSHPRIPITAEVESRRAGPSHKMDLKCYDVKEVEIAM